MLGAKVGDLIFLLRRDSKVLVNPSPQAGTMGIDEHWTQRDGEVVLIYKGGDSPTMLDFH